MAIVAGIDEAGLGPLLGPLVMSAAVFRIPDRKVEESLWELLSDSCSSHPSKKDRRLCIADSKVLFKSRGSLAPLERAALVMLAVQGDLPETLEHLLSSVAPAALSQLEHCPWYGGGKLALPLSHEVGDIPTRMNAIRRSCSTKGIALLQVFCEPLFERRFNEMVHATRNKAAVLMSLAMMLIDRILRCSNERRIRVDVDRLGGRMHYRDALQTTFPEYDLQILEESEDLSLYRMHSAARVVRVSFATGGEKRSLPVALASIYSKYIRELFMHLFNEYWSKRVVGLKPTAGYYTDARRWLAEVEPTLRELAIPESALVRQR